MQPDDGVVCFGEWEYEFSTGIIRSVNSENSSLIKEFHLSQSMQVLLRYLIENPGRIISKQELISLFGDGLNESCPSILRIVPTLRKILGDSGANPKYIVTLRKRGYRFIANVERLQRLGMGELSKSNAIDESSSFFYKSAVFKLTLFLLLLFSLLLFFRFYYLSGLADTINLPSSSISSMSGAELELSISPDGKYVAYTHTVNMEDNYKIIVQNIKSKEKWILKSADKNSLHGLQWTGEGDAIIYQYLERNKKCEIRKLRFDPSTYQEISDELITNCGIFSFATKIQITPDQKFIFFSSKDNITGPISIVRYSLDSKISQTLTAPPASGLGDYRISISPDGENLAFLRNATQTHAQLWMMNLNDGALEMLYESDDFFPSGITWSNDKGVMLFSGNSNNIDVFDIEKRTFISRIETDCEVLHLAQTTLGDLIFSGGNFWESTVWKIDYANYKNNGMHAQAIETTSSDSIIQVNPTEDGPLAVLSERTGQLSLWFYYPDGRQIEIFGLPVKNEYSKGEFSPDGKKFLLQTGDQIWIIDGNRHRRLSFDKHKISAQFSWSSDGQKILYTASVYGTLQVYSLDLVTGAIELVDETLALYAESPDGSYTIKLRHSQKQLEITDSSGQSHFLPAPGEFGILRKRIVLRNNAIYFLHRADGSTDLEVLKYNVLDRSLEYTGIKQKLQGRIFAVSYDERFIFTDDGKKGDIDVRLLVDKHKK